MAGQTASVVAAGKSSLRPLIARAIQNNSSIKSIRSSSSAAAATTKLAYADAQREVKKANAPPSALSIQTVVRRGIPPKLRTPTTPSSQQTAGAAIREIGCTRRVFLLNSHLNTDELHGLAYRMDLLGRNTAINSVLIATTDDDDVEHGALPTCLVDLQREKNEDPVLDFANKERGSNWHVSGGYDARAAFESGLTKDPVEVERLLEGIRRLALAARGGESLVAAEDFDSEDNSNEVKYPPVESRVPIITVPHGLVNDGGYALCMGSYVLATRDSTVRFLNPWKGLSFDPIGLSYVLPRLGWEFRQESADYPVGMLMALTGYEADAFDMVETGLATHYIDSPTKVGILERELGSNVVPWEQQGLYRKRKKLYGQKDDDDVTAGGGPGGFRGRRKRFDPNDKYRNVAVANVLHSISEFDASGKEMLASVDAEMRRLEDPSLVLEHDRFFMDAPRSSQAVNIAAAFADFFAREKSVEGVVEQLKEVASSHKDKSDPEERECGEVAADLASKMESACPLSLKVVHRLMMLGSKNSETLESCMKRELNVQKHMLIGEDFERWAKSGVSGTDQGGFRGWKHESLKDVTNDEVEEILSK
uniref:3-hydroxyisobutyryl-CoA hydrolase n=1 Tax=Ditylum brightwellii TaxID=49249 RepID=A0A6U4AC76_9STRA|mmetsp:Transcript_839/g.1317  ORF Transcript_839/g.1317 Transcript_839/m.1317 type:complete len:593 (+) Transcript_839:141-1919(+)